MKPLTRKRLSCWLIFYALSLAAILAAAGLLALLAEVSNWVTIGLAVWLMLCYASLCFPDDIWDRWMPPESP